MGFFPALNLLFLFGSLIVRGPAYPPNAVSSGTIVAELHFHAGKMERAKILSGSGSFSDSCMSAFAGWHSDKDGDELVIVHFHQPNLYSLSDRKEEIAPGKTQEALPYPIYIIQPSYPINALAQGSVVLRMDISIEGNVTDVKTIESVGGLTESSIEAVQKWKFKSSKDAKGRAMPSHAYAVLVYRLPVLSPSAK
jgi:TonB family protein